MLRFLSICCVLLITALFLSCGDKAQIVSNDEIVSNEDKIKIKDVLYERWAKGFKNEKMEIYLSSFWEKDFRHESNNATEDTSDDVIFKDINQEKASAQSIFDKFKEIQMDISEPTIELLSKIENEANAAKVYTNYRIQFILDGDDLNNSGYIGYYAEGEITFTFKLIEGGVWRITAWEDKAYSPDTVKAKYAEEE